MNELINPFDPGYYNSEELRKMGFAYIGDNVSIAKNCTIIGLQNISIGNNVRIDGLTTITAYGGSLELGNYIHIGGYCFIGAGAGVFMGDFSGLSQGVKIYSKSDDYSGFSLTNPTIPPSHRDVISGSVVLHKHVIIGSGSVILPKVCIHVGSAVGALSIVSKDINSFEIHAGSPAKFLKRRSQNLLKLEEEYIWCC